MRVIGSGHVTPAMKDTCTLLTTRLARVLILTQSFLQPHEDLLIIQMGKLRHRDILAQSHAEHRLPSFPCWAGTQQPGRCHFSDPR